MGLRFFFVFLLSIPTVMHAAWIVPDQLNITFSSSVPIVPTPDQPQASWDTLCPSWGEKMIHRQGPLGGGIFLHFSCYDGDRLIEGERVETPWKLDIVSDDNSFSFTFLYEKEILAQLKFTPTSHVLTFLQDAEFSTYTALYILDSLPVFRRITKADVESAPFQLESTTVDGIEAPIDLTFYHLDLSAEKKMVWRPHVVASAARQDVDGAVVYALSAAASKWDFSQPIWAHNQQGPGHLAAIAKPILEKKYRFVEQSLLENVEEAFTTGLDKGHVGIRFGVPLIKGDVLGTKTRFVGLVSEFQNGMLKGLSLFIDYWPKITNLVNGKTASFGGVRENIGWTYYVAPIHRFPTLAFGLTPKVGAWNMKIVVPADGKEIPFSVKNSLSLGLSGQVEYTTKPFLFRAYYEKALSVKFSFQTTQVTVDRYGLDGYWNVAQMKFLPKALGVSLLAFAVDEVFSFKKKVSQDDLTSQGVAISDLKYTQIYMGGGVALTW